MVAFLRLTAAVSVLVLAGACHEVTEYTDSGDFGAVILDASDLSVLGYVAGIDGARSLVSMGGNRFLVGTSTGRVYEVDSQLMEIVEHHQVTAGAGAGISRMVKSPSAATIYLLTGMGRILEMDQETFEVVDDFDAGASPSDICRSPASLPRIYVSDAQQGRVREVWTSDNHVGKVMEVPESPVALAGYLPDPDRMVSAHDGEGGVSILNTDSQYYSVLLPGDDGPYSAVAMASTDTIVCAAAPRWNSDGGRVYMIYMAGPEQETVSLSVDGHPTCICVHPLGSPPYFYAACADGDRTVVVALNYLYGRVDITAELEGHPWAITTHQSGEKLIVLTSI